MADPRFFKSAGPLRLADIADALNIELPSAADADREFDDVMPLDWAESNHISFLDNKKYFEAFQTTRAGACIVSPSLAEKAPDSTIVLSTKDPYRSYARVAQMFYPQVTAQPSIAATAAVSDSAQVHESAEIQPGAFIGDNAEIAAGCVVGANSVIGRGCTVAEGTRIGPNVTISHAKIGCNCIIHPGVCIGQDGFGFAMGPEGHEKVPQLGRVLIGDNVEIGANTTIDRGTGPDTEIGNGTKIDNSVQIAHNVVVGQHCVIVSHVGISGSTELGDFVVLAGQVGVAGHLKIGSGVKVAAQSGVMRDIQPGMEMGGSPAKPMRQWMREIATVDRMARTKGK